ncbi:MAG: chemotaxis protein CheW [Cellulosilyticaceae bacterium]
MDTSQYLQIFIDESKDNVQHLNENLLRLETSPKDEQIVNEIFRVAHTLKGMAGTMGFTKMQRLTHHAENVLSEIRGHKLNVDTQIIDILFQCLDALEKYVEEIIQTSSEGTEGFDELIRQLEQLIKRNESEMQVLVGVETTKLPQEVEEIKEIAFKQGNSVFEINICLTRTCILKAARAFLVFNELGDMGEIIHCIPCTQDIEDEKFEREFKVILITTYTEEVVQKAIERVSEIESIEIVVSSKAVKKNSEINPYGQENVPQTLNEEEKQEAKVVKKQQVSGQSVRVNIDRLDTLMNLVSELIIVKTQLEEMKTQKEQNNNYNESIEYLERITTNLHDAVMKVRMVPIETVFNRFPRMIRDVARKLNKEIDLVITGEETELDRIVIDEIGDPLMHLLRNAADHGLEDSEERRQRGKVEKGTIQLKAYQDGNNVIIEVSDDGRGIDANKLRSKAIEKGTMSKGEIEGLSEQEVIQLLFAPSFSTAEKVTDLSGRGVGLDVVKNKITTLGGEVEIKTKVGQGSSFIVRLPLTLAIIQALLVEVVEEKYAIPLSSIQNIEEIEKKEIKIIQNQEVIMIRNQVVPIIRLADVLDLIGQEKEKLMVVIVRKGEKQVGLIVDRLIGQQEIVIKPLGRFLKQIQMIAGATILGNGEVALILDVNTLV